MAPKKARKHTIIDVDAPVIPINKPVVTKKSSSGFFSRVVSNIKGTDMDIPLGACTAIVSERNRAGKTAVLDAVRLALTGKHPIGSNAADLMGLTTDGALPAAALTGVSAGSSFTFAEGRRTGSLTTLGEFQNLREDEAEQMLPMVANRDLLTLGTAKAREGLFRRYGSQVLDAALDAPVGLSPEQVLLWGKAIKSDGRVAATDTVEKLAAAGTWIRSHKRALSASVKALEEEKQRLHEQQQLGGAGVATDDLIRDIQRKIDIHRVLANTGIMRSRAAVSESRLVELAEQYKNRPTITTDEEHFAQLAAIDAQYATDGLRKAVEAAQATIAPLEKNVRLFTLMVGLRKMIPTHGCLVCKTNAEHISANFHSITAEAQHELDMTHAALAAAKQGAAADESALGMAINAAGETKRALHAAREQMMRSLATLIADIKIAKDHYLAAQEMLKEAGVAEEPKETLSELQAQMATLQASKQDAGRATNLARELRELFTAQGDVKVVEKALGDVLNGLVGSVRDAAEQAVNGWMPPGFKAKLMLEDEDGKPACRWEVVGADGRPHPKGAMSGAEQAALTVAIACAWSEGQKYRFLLLDDADLAGFNAENVRVTLTMVAEAVASGRLTQALVAWSRPLEIPDEAWSVVSL